MLKQFFQELNKGTRLKRSQKKQEMKLTTEVKKIILCDGTLLAKVEIWNFHQEAAGNSDWRQICPLSSYTLTLTSRLD